MLLAAVLPAAAQHNGDIAVGRSAAGQLKYKPFDELHPCFDPGLGVGLLTPIPDPPAEPTSWRATTPGFDANFAADPALDYYLLGPGASIYLVAAEDLEPAFRVQYLSLQIRHAGESLPLGSYALHRHVTWIVDCTDPEYDPLRTLWFGTFILDDRGSTNYADSEPFTVRMSIVDCEPGDVNGDGEVGFGDINPFVATLIDPAAADVAARCAADVNRNGYVEFADINPFVAVLVNG
jgi:hypothetical protein